MSKVFADTFYWIALSQPRDRSYKQAMTLSQTLQWSHIVTSEDVLTEYLNYCSNRGRQTREIAWRLVDKIVLDPTIRVISHAQELFSDALQLFKNRPDKGYSLTDCLSMHIMWQEAIIEILTQDRHFAQEGFICLFDNKP